MRSSGEDQYISACILVHVEGSNTHTDTRTQIFSFAHLYSHVPHRLMAKSSIWSSLLPQVAVYAAWQTVQKKLRRFMIMFLSVPCSPSTPALVCVQGVYRLCPPTKAALEGETLISKPRAGAQCCLQWQVITIINIFPSLLMQYQNLIKMWLMS